MKQKEERTLFVCECGDVAHQFVVSHWSDDEEVFVAVKLYRGNILERIGKAFRYVFGMPCKYGDFDEVILNKEKALQLADLLYKKYEVNNIGK